MKDRDMRFRKENNRLLKKTVNDRAKIKVCVTKRAEMSGKLVYMHANKL